MDLTGGGAASARNLYKFERAMLPLMTSDLHPGMHTSSCGHVMHASCWKTYFEDVQQSERNRSRLRSPQNFNALKQVYACAMYYICNSSEIRGVCFMKCSSETLRNLQYFWST